jgi:deoxyribodipyrimidine photo-lyase
MSRRVVIHWFRRDLRLTDNPALHAAAKAGDQVVPLYVLSDWKAKHCWTGEKRQRFLCGCLESLARNLEASGSCLVLRTGKEDQVIEKMLQETRAEAVYFNRDYDPHGRRMEKKVAEVCARLGVRCEGFKDRVLHEASEVRTGSGEPYRVFTPYWRNWSGRSKAQPLGRVGSLGAAPVVASDPLPTVAHWGLQEREATIAAAGERAARDRMAAFLRGGLTKYKDERDHPWSGGGSRLSQDLRFGLLSIRELHARCLEANAGASGETFLKELAWREFYVAILHEFPEVLQVEFNAEFRGMPWEGTDEHFAAWAKGRTGFPIVDAGIRQMLATGFMHNRVRMIVAMFLTKDLHWDWRAGEIFFMQHLVDGEIASNNGGWQWSAGTGADAAPYFRIQNPWTQAARYDPEGAYVREWVPELRRVPAPLLLAPPKDGRPLAPGYPLPIVDHGQERQRTLAAFARHRRR